MVEVRRLISNTQMLMLVLPVRGPTVVSEPSPTSELTHILVLFSVQNQFFPSQ